jgi:hypothetical protein
MSLPTSRCFITQLLDSLPASANPIVGDANPLSAVPETAKNQLLSLQVLFPNEFLPALDLLDRRLVTRLRIGNGGERGVYLKDGDRGIGAQGVDTTATTHSGEPTAGTNNTSTDIPVAEPPRIPNDDQIMPDAIEADVPSHTDTHAIYYVGSAQQRSSRYSTSYDTTTSYEVRLVAWNCSCPAFAFAAFPATHPEPLISTYDPSNDEHAVTHNAESGTWLFGGVSLGNAIPPVCKHLLACVLLEKCRGLFGGFVEERVVSVEEAAGWAAGWGD